MRGLCSGMDEGILNSSTVEEGRESVIIDRTARTLNKDNKKYLHKSVGRSYLAMHLHLSDTRLFLIAPWQQYIEF